MVLRPLALVVLLSSALSGCVLAPNPTGAQHTLCVPDRPSVSFPSIFIANETGIHRLSRSAKTGTYVVTRSLTPPPAPNTYPKMIRSIPGGLLAVWDGKLVHYRNDLSLVREIQGDFGSIAVQGDVIYLGGKGELKTVNLGLASLDTVGFHAGTHKTSHEVLVCGGRAFLLDNVVVPLYTYVVDVSDPRRMDVVSEDEFDGLSHLHAQWIDSETDAWNIVVNSGGMGYANQAIRQYGLDGGSPRTTPLHYESQGYSEETATESGFRILGVWPASPPWMIVGQNGSTYLGRVDVGDKAEFRPLLDLKAASTSSFYGAPTSAANATLVTVVEDELRIVDLAQRRLVHSQALTNVVFDIEIEWLAAS
jgi:hypothetical protein